MADRYATRGAACKTFYFPRSTPMPDRVRAYNHRMWRCLVFLLLATTLAAQAGGPGRVEFATKSLPTAKLGKRYELTFKLQGGRGPFGFRISKGKLPPGLHLQPALGMLMGVPTQSGVYKFTVSVQDETAHTAMEREFELEVAGPLLVEWIDRPVLSGNTISGSIKVTNFGTRQEPYDLTAIIVAVNEIGKAFALGYQHFPLEEDTDQTIPFSSTLPNGSYIVHVDAIAEVAATNTIYRSRLQTPSPLVVNVNR